MAEQNRIAKILRLIDLVWGSISLLFMIFMVGVHIEGAFTGESDGGGFGSTTDLVSFIFFPHNTMLRLALAWKWEG